MKAYCGFFLLLLGLLSCASQPAVAPVQLKLLQRSSHCALAGAEPQIYRVEVGQKLPGYHVPFDPSQQHWLLSMGQQPTGGYSLDLAPEAELLDGQLTLQVMWHSPGADAIVTQALTRPCLLFALPAQPLQRLRVVDQEGRLRIDMETSKLPQLPRQPAPAAERWPS